MRLLTLTQLRNERKRAASSHHAAQGFISTGWRRFDPKLRLRHYADSTTIAIGGRQEGVGEIAAGKYRGALHCIPFGVKDLLDRQDRDHLRC